MGIIMLYAMFAFYSKIQNKIAQQSLYEDCVVKLLSYDNKSYPADSIQKFSQFENLVNNNEINSELFQNVAVCIDEKKTENELYKKDIAYQIGYLFWCMVCMNCLVWSLGILLGWR
jgi:hypothetical protein